MNKQIRFVFLIICFSFANFVFLYSESKISGILINSETNEKISNAKISIIENSKNVITDIDGEFELIIDDNNIYTLLIEANGFMKEEIPISSYDKREISLGKISLFVDYVSLSLEDLMNVNVVSASKKNQKVINAPATIFVIHREQIENNGYNYLFEYLNDLPGVELCMNATVEVSSTFVFRGINGNPKFLVLVDGNRISSSAGSRYNLDYNFPINNAERIEVLLGPSSALYGADAFSGIINIISQKPTGDFFVNFNGYYGSYNSTSNSLTFGKKYEDLSILASANIYHSDEPKLPEIYPNEFKWYNERYKTKGEMSLFGKTVVVPIEEYTRATDAYSASLKINFQGFSSGFIRNFQEHSSAVSAPDSISLSINDARFATTMTNFYSNYDYSNSDQTLAFHSSISHFRFETLPHSAYVNSFSDYTKAFKFASDYTTQIEQQLSYNISENQNLIFGISYDFASAIPKSGDLPMEFDKNKPADFQDLYWPGTNIVDKNGNSLKISQDFMTISYQNFGSFIQYETNLFNQLSLTLGSRYDYNSLYKSSFNPRLGIVYNPINSISINFLYGKAFLAPSIYDSYQQFGSFYAKRDSENNVIGLASNFLHLASLDLKPEINNCFEGTIKVIPNENMYFAVNGFYNSLTNLIKSVITTNESYKGVNIARVERATNKGEAKTYGALMMFNAKFPISTDFLNLNISYSYIDGDIDGNPLVFSAKHTLKGTLSYQAEKYNLKLTSYSASGNYTSYATPENNAISDEYLIFNAYVEYALFDSLRIYVKVNNLTNSSWYLSSQYNTKAPQDPIRILSGIKLSI